MIVMEEHVTTIEVLLVVLVQQDVQATVVKVVLIFFVRTSKTYQLFFLSSRFKRIFARFIHALIRVNVFPKVAVDVVFACHHIMAMIAEKVTYQSENESMKEMSDFSISS